LSDRRRLLKAVKYVSIVAGIALLYVLLDFTIDVRPARIHSSYQFSLDRLPVDSAIILRQDNLSIVVIRRSPEAIKLLRDAGENLQDPHSGASSQPNYANNNLRSLHPGYYVSYAIGTDLGCGLVAIENGLREICSQARYDFAGRALKGSTRFENLAIPDYNFSDNFNTLIIRP
jgi:ubiquinol-cytochrome c reductase iron-sulfur subunit